jgi:serine protease AprX
MFRSIRTINADVAQAEFGARGQGIVWAVRSTGVESSHKHFKTYQSLSLPDNLSHWDFSDVLARARRLSAKRAAERDVPAVKLGRQVRLPVDAYGRGTSVAAVIAGESTPTDYDELLRGMAPECKLLSINVFNKAGKAEE